MLVVQRALEPVAEQRAELLTVAHPVGKEERVANALRREVDPERIPLGRSRCVAVGAAQDAAETPGFSDARLDQPPLDESLTSAGCTPAGVDQLRLRLVQRLRCQLARDGTDILEPAIGAEMGAGALLPHLLQLIAHDAGRPGVETVGCDVHVFSEGAVEFRMRMVSSSPNASSSCDRSRVSGMRPISRVSNRTP